MWLFKQWVKRMVKISRSLLEKFQTKRIERQWQKRSQKLPRSTDGKMLLHIGCGDINSPGFINVDARPLPHVHILTTKLYRLTLIPNDTIDLIYMSHVLEHVSHREIISTLCELHRILKIGGVLRISVPDFDLIVKLYQAAGRDITVIERPLLGGQDYPFNFHYTAFNDEHLR